MRQPTLHSLSHLKMIVMKKMILAAAVALFSITSFGNPTKEVLESFKSSYPNAQSVTWSEDRDLHMVYFKQGKVQHRLWYNKEGIVEKAFRYYGKEALPSFVRSRVEDRHEGKEIMGVVETTDGVNGLKYIIALHDDTHWYELEVSATGYMEQTKKFKKI